VWRLHANANYEWQINDLVGVHASANYFNYDTIVSNKENINGDLGVSLNLDEKIKMNTSISYLGRRKSVRGFQDSLQNYHINYNDPFSLNSQFHANISIDYNYTKYISAYLRINNIFNSKQDMWEGYQEIGRNAWFGLSYSF
jgi:outer membrane receptor protein involved in Fe transport